MFDFRTEEGEYGKRFLPQEEWSPEMTDYCLSNNIRDVYANIALGWPGHDLSFVKDLPELLSLEVLTDRVDDLAVIECLAKLRFLSLSLIITERIDFSQFPEIEEVHLGWSPKAKSVLRCTSLRRLLMTNYKSTVGDLSAFCSLSNLECLWLKVCNITSTGDLSCLTHLRRLEINRATKLMSLDGIEALRGLQELHVETCRRITRIDPVGQLTNLERLLLPNNGEIESIKPLRGLKKLRQFLFYESTNIKDGDLTPLKALPSLQDVAFQPRRHYNLKQEDLPNNPDLWGNP
jgi:Leucine-rich repeat (LRR) protein